MKIIISHVFSKDNGGDAALLSVLISDIHKTFPGAQINILTIDRIAENETFDDVPVRHSFMYWATNRFNNRVMKAGYSFYMMGLTLAWACIFRLIGKNIPLPARLDVIAKLYEDADLIIPVGGGYLRGKPGVVSMILLLLMLHPLVIARILNKPNVNYSQSVGPFGSKLQEFFAAQVLKRTDCVIVREDTSLKLLKRLGVSNIVRTIDSGFLFSTNIKMDLRKGLNITKKQIVGITVRNWLDKSGQEKYENAMAQFADYIVERYDMAVIFIPQVTTEYHKDDDRVIGRKVYELMKHKESAYMIDESYNHQTVKSFYDGLNLMVGTRFHSVIFSLTSFVPAVAIEYEHKTSGIMNDLGLSEWVLKMEDVTAEKLEKLFDKLLINQDSYRKKLLSIIPPYVNTYKAPVIMKEVYERYMKS